MFVGLSVQNFSQIGQVVSSYEWSQTDRQTDRRTYTHTHTRLRFLPRDNHNTFSPLKKTECKKRERPAAFRDFIRKYYF